MEVFINYVFGLFDGDIELLGKWFITNAVKQSSFKYHPVTLVENPFVNQGVPLASGKVIILNIQDILSPFPQVLQIRFRAALRG